MCFIDESAMTDIDCEPSYQDADTTTLNLQSLEMERLVSPQPTARLREAMLKNELVLYGQPIADLTAGSTHAMAEALIRLREEEAALLPPGEFLPMFERYRMMPDLDRWVIAKAVMHLTHRPRIARLTINASNQSLEDRGIIKFIAEAVMASATPASKLVFEIDNSAFIEQPELVSRFAAAVKSIGCQVLIDGVSASRVSFIALKGVRVDMLKVDGAIVRNIARDASAEVALRAIARVASSIGVELIAEMVEDQQVLAALAPMGVRYAQGYGICPPYPMQVLLDEHWKAKRGLADELPPTDAGHALPRAQC